MTQTEVAQGSWCEARYRVTPPAFLWPALDTLSFAAGLLLVGPLTVARVGGWYDDFLFVRLARFLLHGQWLGPFDSLTLIKGPFYPIFLAACAAGGVPVQVGTQSIYLGGALLLARTAGLLAGGRGVGSLCFALLALNPACFDWTATMLMREQLYGGLTTLVLALAARTLLCSDHLFWPVLLGLAGAAFWAHSRRGHPASAVSAVSGRLPCLPSAVFASCGIGRTTGRGSGRAGRGARGLCGQPARVRRVPHQRCKGRPVRARLRLTGPR